MADRYRMHALLQIQFKLSVNEANMMVFHLAGWIAACQSSSCFQAKGAQASAQAQA
jgi:hypothetical protein